MMMNRWRAGLRIPRCATLACDVFGVEGVGGGCVMPETIRRVTDVPSDVPVPVVEVFDEDDGDVED